LETAKYVSEEDLLQLLIDSAIIQEVRQAGEWGWVRGATTNPTLLAQSELPPEQTLQEMGKVLPGEIFYQLTGNNLESMQTEAAKAADILGDHLVLKIPATPLGFQATALLSNEYPVAVTSIFTAAQAMVAHCAGARYVLYYHNRAKHLLPAGQSERLPADMVSVLQGTDTQVVAASFKTPEEVIEARMAGAAKMSVKFDVLALLTQNEFSEQALREFEANGTGLLT
jgi:transaldolase